MVEPSFYSRLELSLPGSWIDHTDRDYAWTVRWLLHWAVEQYHDAVVACQYFEPIPSDLEFDVHGEVTAWCDPVKDRLRGICARAYVYALDTACSYVKTLSEQPLNTRSTIAACNAFLQRFAEVRHIRNSLAQGRRGQGSAIPVGGARTAEAGNPGRRRSG